MGLCSINCSLILKREVTVGDLFLGPCVGVQARAGRARCRFTKEQLLRTCLSVGSVETLTNATCAALNIRWADERRRLVSSTPAETPR